MWITLMNLLILFAVLLLIIITGIAVRAYKQERHDWNEIKEKAKHSDINEFSE